MPLAHDPDAPDCPLCHDAGGTLVWQDADWRVVRVADIDFPAYYRVIASRHLAEFTDLNLPQRAHCMALVGCVEQVLRERLQPTKVNLASLGNMTPHLHWHVIARFDWDSHFPQAVWGERQRTVVPDAAQRLPAALHNVDRAIATAADALAPALPGPDGVR